MNTQFETMAGTNEVKQDEVGHLIIPGRYRSPDGMGLHPFTEMRVDTAAAFYMAHTLFEEGGIVICSGYKNPADENGKTWVDKSGITYQGIPEAYGMKARLMNESNNLPEQAIRTEVESVDTVTNFTHSQDKFLDKLSDDRPIGIVAQEQHLERIIKIVAPKILKRDFVGIIVPEIPGYTDEDGLVPALISKYISRRLYPEMPWNSLVADIRATNLWSKVLFGKKLPIVGKVIEKAITPPEVPHLLAA